MPQEQKKTPEQIEAERWIIYPIKCRFCGADNGNQMKLLREKWEGREVNDEILGIADHRCDACSAAHGSYKEMHDFFMQTSDDKHEDFLAHIEACDFKAPGFLRRMLTEKPQRLFDDHVTQQLPLLHAERVKLDAELGIQDLDHPEKCELALKVPDFAKAKVTAEKNKIISKLSSI